MPEPSTPTWYRVEDPEDTGGHWLKWGQAEVGAELEGIWLGPQESTNPKYDNYGAVKIAGDRIVNFGLPLLLRRRLDTVEAGRKIRITYMGTRETKTGASYHVFDVHSDKPALGPGAATRGALPAAAQQEDDDVPF